MIYSEEQVRKHFEELTRLLIKKGISITAMESCTSGQLASLITDTEGASSIFKGSFVTYSNEIKILEGVRPEIIDKYTVYSEETALEMAMVCKDKIKADIGIGVTGTMGNVDPFNKEASTPGMVYFAVIFNEKKYFSTIKLPAMEKRLQYKLTVCEEIYQRLMDIINQAS